MQTYNELKAENELLRSLIAKLQMDCTFGILNKNGAMMLYGNVEDGKNLIFIDLCNVHAANHKHTMAGYDAMINKMLDSFRHSDTIIKYGGDELVIILNSGNPEEYMKRMDYVMQQNNIYAVMVSVKTQGGLQKSIDKADAIVSEVKMSLELNGMKPDRNEEYTCLDSHIIVA